MKSAASELKSGAQWETEGEVQDAGVAGGSAVQSVQFALLDLKLVRTAARQAGMTTSEFIRAAAIEKAGGSPGDAGAAVADAPTPGRRGTAGIQSRDWR